MPGKRINKVEIIDHQKLNQMFNRGMQYHRENQLEKAKKIYEHILKISAKQPHVLHMLGVLAYHENKLSRSLQLIKKAIAFEPEQASFYLNLGSTLKKMGKQQEAEHSFIKALEIDPTFYQAYYNLGNLYLHKGELLKAEMHYKRSLQINTNYAEAWCQLGQLKEFEFNFELAEKYYTTAIEVAPNYAIAYHNLGLLYGYQKKYTLAINSLEKSFAIDKNAETCNQLSIHHEKSGNLAAAIFYAKQANQENKNEPKYIAHLYHLYRLSCDWKNQNQLFPQFLRCCNKAIHLHQKAETPFMSVLYFQNPKHNQCVAQNWAKPQDQIAHQQAIQFNFHPVKDKAILKIAYLSNDFYNHATLHLIRSMLLNHDRKRFEIYLFSYSPFEDKYTHEIKNYCDVFINIYQTNDSQAAELIHKHQIDILVDLKGHTGDARLGIAARRPASIQINYLGFPGTCGASFYDYMIVDRVTVPNEHIQYYDEKLIFMPETYQITDNQQPAISNKYDRKYFNLPEDMILLANFNQRCRLSEEVFQCWLTILTNHRNCVLWLLNESTLSTKNLLNTAQKYKVDISRIIFADQMSRHEHLERLSLADLILDTLTYNGHTSTSDALWAGVPVVTVLGTHFSSRVAASLLKAHGLPELIKNNLTEYLQQITYYLQNPKKLYILKEKTRDLKMTGKLFQTEKFTKNLESAYNQAWYQLISHQPKTHIYL